MSEPIDIFFSYAREDESLMDDVRRQLIGADRRGVIRKWHDRLIQPGKEWESQIDKRLYEAKIILLFVSPFFIESKYCYNIEMAAAMERHERGEARVIPIILRPCLWKDELIGKLLALPTDGKPLELWPNRQEGALDVAKGIIKVVKELNLRIANNRRRVQ